MHFIAHWSLAMPWTIPIGLNPGSERWLRGAFGLPSRGFGKSAAGEASELAPRFESES